MALTRAWRGLAVAVAGAVAVVGLSACGGDGGSSSSKGVPAEVKTVDRLRFDPDGFQVRFDRETSFALVNTDNVEHNFTLTHVFIDADNFVSVDVKPGETADVTFTVKERPKSGTTFTFYCRFHQHQGMSGKITVT